MQGSTRLLAILAMGSALGIGSASQAELYRYVDANGTTHVVSSIDMIPPEYRKAAMEDLVGREGDGSLSVVHGSNSASTAAPAAPRQAGPSGATASTPSTIGGHDEYWWRTQTREKEENLESLRKQYEAAKAEDEDWSSQIYGTGARGSSRPSAHRNRRTAAVMSAASDDDDEPTTEELGQAVTKAEADLERFHDDARRLGVPPGWLR